MKHCLLHASSWSFVWFIWAWRWWNVPLKHQQIYKGLYDVISQKIEFFRSNYKIYLPHYTVLEDEGTPILSQQHMSQEACWRDDIEYQGAVMKINHTILLWINNKLIDCNSKYQLRYLKFFISNILQQVITIFIKGELKAIACSKFHLTQIHKSSAIR